MRQITKQEFNSSTSKIEDILLDTTGLIYDYIDDDKFDRLGSEVYELQMKFEKELKSVLNSYGVLED